MAYQEIQDLVRPSQETYERVEQWLVDAGVHIIDKRLNGVDFLRVQMPLNDAERLLDVRLSCFAHVQHDEIKIFRSLDHYSVDDAVGDHIDLISGVVRFPHVKNTPLPNDDDEIVGFKTTPQSIQQRYNITVPKDMSGKNSQSVVSFLGQYWSPSDLEKFQKNFDLPVRPIDHLYGFNDPNKPGVEASLDVQYLSGVLDSSIPTVVYSTNGTTPSGNEPFLDWLELLNTQSSIPYVFSISYQDYENTVGNAYAIRVNTEFQKNTLRGSTFATGSGDSGVGCKDLGTGGVSCSTFNAEFPSTSPVVVSLGATTLSAFTQIEESIDFSSGGFSNIFGRQSYQEKAVSQFLSQPELPPSSYYNQTGLGFPDLSTIGKNFQVFYKGIPIPVAGTSASTPTFAAMVSMMNTLRLNANQPTLGFIQPFLYEAW
eukprot:CAMPEP_0201553018 /NCGR_PEP_ID=MMETSP0173_2-20130828/19394_1 /ASSEMBLY_ACC=CAM_ASM_000268 /TAXON_ID=218659 /ORGANISM="Vexillifera sp., Strain DIVA3 564/2" /LENGTH=426 /DNA_ID=CAMNT_0047963619 /DNA_START=249 /DNA_END=1526 /DNA_ORIENTATION=+